MRFIKTALLSISGFLTGGVVPLAAQQIDHVTIDLFERFPGTTLNRFIGPNLDGLPDIEGNLQGFRIEERRGEFVLFSHNEVVLFSEINPAGIGNRSVRITRTGVPVNNSLELGYIFTPDSIHDLTFSSDVGAAGTIDFLYNLPLSDFSNHTNIEFIFSTDKADQEYTFTLGDINSQRYTYRTSALNAQATGVATGAQTELRLLIPISEFAANGLDTSRLLDLEMSMPGQNNGDYTFKSLTIVPEPSTPLLFSLTSGLLLIRRRR